MELPPLEAILESVLNSYQLRVSIVSDARYCGHWYEDEPAGSKGLFHLVGEGECELGGPMLPAPVRLRAGDLAVLPTGQPHRLGSIKGATYTSLLCGELDFTFGTRNPVLHALPDCFVLRAEDGGDILHKLAALLIDVAHTERMGYKVVMNKLADSLFALALCDYAQRTPSPRGLFAALADPRMTRVLDAMHRRCGEDWTLQLLAEVAGMSRSAFAELFHQLLGEPPMQYLSHWRVAEARRLLQDRRLSVAAIAEMLGYRSEAAFRKRFKQLEGIGPGAVRAGISPALTGES